MKQCRVCLFAATVGLAAACLATSAIAFDATAAKSLAKRNDCTKCHAIDKDKKGPSYHRIARRYSGRHDAEARLMNTVTARPTVKLSDGTVEQHKSIDTNDPHEITNLLQWILAQ